MSAIMFVVAILFLFYAFVLRTINENQNTNHSKQFSKKAKQLYYFDFSRRCEIYAETGEKCEKFLGFDVNSIPYIFCLASNGKFLGAKYNIFDDVPIRYQQNDIDFFLEQKYITSISDLYKRWNGKTPSEMPEGTYDLVKK